ncbi:ankyrin repeat-containing domain protein, partial [Tricharina praecox]|uniref:ankyrin repeat-containing domain protein n=1 Tax=Tricharina praecox TaxID=43433 RepID=UPI00221FD060
LTTRVGPRCIAASEMSDEALVRLVIEYGAKISFATKDGRMPLHRAVERGHEAVTRLLIQKGNGADVSAGDEGGLTSLHLAVQLGDSSMAWLLVKNGADVSVADKYGRTPLYRALEKVLDVVARLLVERGANVDAATKMGGRHFIWLRVRERSGGPAAHRERSASVNCR